MKCPFCGEDEDRVVDSRSAADGEAIRRRRECAACGERFTTYEHVERAAPLTVVKKDNTRVPFDPQKILAGLEKACYKRPVSTETMEQIVRDVEDDLSSHHDREVEALEIGRAVANRLKQIDQVAYVRFASVYKQFRDLDDLLDEVRDVIEASDDDDVPDQGRLF
ncbi:MAG: transcriptional regulator NrdR [Phycisphaeraceae bacterium]|nr:transcriptional regulator NrdR [Phycisphaeraceae bacterium]